MFDKEKAYQFLMGLSDDLYGKIQSQILTQEPLPQLKKMLNMVVQRSSIETWWWAKMGELK